MSSWFMTISRSSLSNEITCFCAPFGEEELVMVPVRQQMNQASFGFVKDKRRMRRIQLSVSEDEVLAFVFVVQLAEHLLLQEQTRLFRNPSYSTCGSTLMG